MLVLSITAAIIILAIMNYIDFKKVGLEILRLTIVTVYATYRVVSLVLSTIGYYILCLFDRDLEGGKDVLKTK